MKEVYGQSRPKNSQMNALTRLSGTETNKKAKGGSIMVLQQPPN